MEAIVAIFAFFWIAGGLIHLLCKASPRFNDWLDRY